MFLKLSALCGGPLRGRCFPAHVFFSPGIQCLRLHRGEYLRLDVFLCWLLLNDAHQKHLVLQRRHQRPAWTSAQHETADCLNHVEDIVVCFLPHADLVTIVNYTYYESEHVWMETLLSKATYLHIQVTEVSDVMTSCSYRVVFLFELCL